MITEDKKLLMRKVINCFENDSGSANTDYSSMYIYHDGPGNRRQITLGFGITEYGNLKSLIQTYIEKGGSKSSSFQPYLSKIGSTPLVDNAEFKNLLIRTSKEDQVMKDSEDKIFNDKYFAPAQNFFNKNGFSLPLSLMMCLDTYIHSGSFLHFLLKAMNVKFPNEGGDEKAWVKQYVQIRRHWLANNPNKILRGTVYRMDFFLKQIENNNWDLNPPFRAHDTNIGA